MYDALQFNFCRGIKTDFVTFPIFIGNSYHRHEDSVRCVISAHAPATSHAWYR